MAAPNRLHIQLNQVGQLEREVNQVGFYFNNVSNKKKEKNASTELLFYLKIFFI